MPPPPSVPPPPPAASSLPPPPPPAAPVAPPPPKPATKPRGRGVALAIIGTVVVLALAAGAFWGWKFYSNRLSDSAVLAALDAQIGAGKIHFATVALESVKSAEQERTFRFKADGALAGDLFRRREITDTLREKFADSFDRLEALNNELATPAGAHLVELAKLGEPPADPLAFVLLEKSATAGASIAATGQLTATRGPDGWKLEVTPGDFTPALPLGKPRASHPEKALLVADPAFAKTLADTVAARLAFAEKLDTARVQVAEQLRQERDARQAALLVALQPGALFLGQAEPIADGATAAPGLVLEIASVKANARQVTALLRNEGDWTDTRSFTGTWETDADFTALKVPLATRTTNAVADAGPLVGLRENWTIDLSLDPEGHLVGQSLTHKYTFARVPSAELERTRSELRSAHDAALAATRPGAAYRGTVALKSSGEPVPALLRFTRQDGDGAKIEAEIELVAQPGRARSFRGYVAVNPHRTGDRPIRLLSEARRRVAKAEATSVTGLAMDLAPALALKGDTLSGSDESFEYSFSAANPDELNRLVASQQSAQAAVLGSLKRGASFDGSARHRDGFTTPARIRFTRVDDDGTVEAVVESLKRPGVNLRVAGTADFATRQLQLASTGGRPDTDNDLRVPFFTLNAKFTLLLALTERTLEGKIEHDGDWVLTFNLGGGAVAAPAELPAWPKAGGAYALIGGAWQPLPSNNGHPVNSANARLAKAASRKDAPAKVAELVFDGKDPVPAIPPSTAVVIIYVGVVTGPSAEQIKQYPDELAGYPGLELAPARKPLVGSKRIADLFRVTPEIAGFQSARIAATLSEPEREITVLVPNVALPPGNYALLANGAAYELQVK